jgi:hypothetical protein
VWPGRDQPRCSCRPGYDWSGHRPGRGGSRCWPGRGCSERRPRSVWWPRGAGLGSVAALGRRVGCRPRLTADLGVVAGLGSWDDVHPENGRADMARE